jgi:hypothetical protein
LEHIPFAFWLVEALKPEVFVELGTQSGISYAAFAQAVQTLGLPTACYAVDTWRGDPQSGFYDESVFDEWAAYHSRHFGGFSRLVRSTFEEAVSGFSDGAVDLLHIDGYHTYESVSADFNLWMPKVSRRGVVLIHDINVREKDFGAWRAWEVVRSRYPSFEFLHGHGLGMLGIGADIVPPLRWLFSIAATSPEQVAEVRKFFSYLGGMLSSRFAAEETGRRLGAEFEERFQRLGEELQISKHRMALGEDAAVTLRLEVAEASRRIADLESQLSRRQSELDEALAEERRVAVGFHQRVKDERERRVCVELENLWLKSRAARIPAPSRSRVARLKQRVASAVNGMSFGPLVPLARTIAGLGLDPRRPNYRSFLAIALRPKRLRQAHVVMNSGLFDASYYRERYPDVVAGGLTPLSHFVLSGSREGRDPHPLFDTAYYLNHLSGASMGIEAFTHYQKLGAFEGLSPHPLFDIRYYLEKSPDLRTANADPLQHFLTRGAREGRNPNEFFDCAYYLQRYPDVFHSRINPLVHFARTGWREGRRASAAFDTEYYLSSYEDVRKLGVNPLVHYLQVGRFQDRRTVDESEDPELASKAILPKYVKLEARSLGAAPLARPTVLCVTHVMPWPPRAGNGYRIYRMLLWLRDQGFRIVLLIAPLPGEPVNTADLRPIADRFSNVVICDRQGRIEYILDDVPDVLASLNGEFARPIAALADEDSVRDARQRQLLHIDRTFCHDALITTVLRLHPVLGSYVLLAEYIWMSRVLPLVEGDVLKVVDTHDVFSTKQDKVLSFGVEDLHLEPHEEAYRLRRADLVVAIQNEERDQLAMLVPDRKVLTAGVDFDVTHDAGFPVGCRILYVGSDNPTNEKGLSDFLEFAWPRIRRAVPPAELIVAGKVGRNTSDDTAGVVRLGMVEDLRPLYREARLAINPAVAGTGLKIKVLEALCHFRPIITWPNGVDGLAPELAALCVTALDWYEFTQRVVDLLVAEPPRLFSSTECDAITRLTFPAAAYSDLTEAFRRHTGDPLSTNRHEPRR